MNKFKINKNIYFLNYFLIYMFFSKSLYIKLKYFKFI